MGLSTTHDAWHGAYSSFMRWRTKIAEVAGLPPLELMEGFYSAQDRPEQYMPPTIYLDPFASELSRNSVKHIEESGLPIKWEALKPSPLHELLQHSDCDGEIPAASCGPIADELANLMPLLPDGEGGGHIGVWREKTQLFIDGLRRAAAANEPLGFH